MAACQRGKRSIIAMRERNDKLLDPIIGAQLSHLTDVMATIEVTAILARSGEYKQEIIK